MSVNAILLSAVPTVILRVKSDQKSNFPGVMTCMTFFMQKGDILATSGPTRLFQKSRKFISKSIGKSRYFSKKSRNVTGIPEIPVGPKNPGIP